jgi:hypothetical protein
LLHRLRSESSSFQCRQLVEQQLRNFPFRQRRAPNYFLINAVINQVLLS